MKAPGSLLRLQGTGLLQRSPAPGRMQLLRPGQVPAAQPHMPGGCMRLDTGQTSSMPVRCSLAGPCHGCRLQELREQALGTDPCVAEQQAPALTTGCMTCWTSAMQPMVLGRLLAAADLIHHFALEPLMMPGCWRAFSSAQPCMQSMPFTSLCSQRSGGSGEWLTHRSPPAGA